MKKLITICLAATIILAISGVANADWMQGDSYKMHYPQLPDPQGWDVDFNYSGAVFADDFLCTETGSITDIHFWVSWKNDQVGSITGIDARIANGNPSDWSWTRTFLPDKFTIAGPSYGSQGWDDPSPDSEYISQDHTNYYQVNIKDITNPFIQQAGTTYWLELKVWMDGGYVGWKTTLDSWGSSAQYWAFHPIEGGGYYYSWDPIAIGSDNHPTDLAFVITPEPATICLLGLGALSLIRRKTINKNFKKGA
jgi:hypothetical protein